MLTGLLLAAAALLAPQDHVQAEASVYPVPGGDASAVHVVVDLDIASGWHIYHPEQDPALGIPVSVSLNSGAEATGDLMSRSPAKPHLEFIGQLMLEYKWLEGKAQLELPAKLADATAASEIEVVVNYQVCDDKVCLAPASTTLTVAYDPATAQPEPTLASQEEATEQGEVSELSGEKIKIRGSFTSATVPQGGTARLRIETDIEAGWHIYDPRMDPDVPGIPFQAQSGDENFILAGPLEAQQDAIEHMEDFGGGLLYTYLWVEGNASFEVDVPVKAEPGEYKVPITLRWQVCDESICLDNAEDTFEIAITVTEGDAEAAAALTTTDADRGAINVDPTKVLNDGFWALIWAAVAAGFATLLTPCVFPMIPITVSFFTKRAEAGKGSAMGNASAYAAGIILTFVGLGLGAAAILGATGANQIASSPWLNLMIAGLFLVLAFSLLGFFEIQPPRFLANFASKAQADGQQKGGYLPVVIMAFAFSVTAFTCTVGFVGGLLGLAALGEWWYAAAAMTVYAIIFATPFFFLALFPNTLQKMPSAGGWMNAVKVSFGYIEIIAAWKFLSSAERVWDMEILTRPVIIVLTVIPLLLWAGYMFGLYTMKGDYGQKPPRTLPRVAVGVLALASAGYVASGYPYKNYQGWVEAYFPPVDYGNPYGPLGLMWEESASEALAKGREENQVVFLDFTGVTCVNCLRMEGNIFPVPEVAEKIESVTRGHLYVDKPPYGDENGTYQVETFGLASQPYYAVMDPFTGEALATFNGYDPDPQAFAAFLQEGIDKGAARGIGSATLTSGSE